MPGFRWYPVAAQRDVPRIAGALTVDLFRRPVYIHQIICTADGADLQVDFFDDYGASDKLLFRINVLTNTTLPLTFNPALDLERGLRVVLGAATDFVSIEWSPRSNADAPR